METCREREDSERGRVICRGSEAHNTQSHIPAEQTDERRDGRETGGANGTMEDAIRKQGLVLIQQQRFGKRWKRVWLMLFMESSCSIARLEYFDCKDGAAAVLDRCDKALKRQQDSKKVIRLSDCIRVAAVPADGCPRDKGTFLVETTDKLFVFAVDEQHLDDWTHTLCETAFPSKRCSLQKRGRNDKEGMEDNSLYSSRETLRDFRVCVRRTKAAERCGLTGVCVLRTDAESLHLLDPSSHQLLFSWPYRFLRRFGRDKTSFSFEAGRRCDSGEGSFEFDTRQGNTLFQALDTAIKAHPEVLPQRPSCDADNSPDISLHRALYNHQQPGQGGDCEYSRLDDFEEAREKGVHKKLTLSLSHLEPPADKILTGVKSLTLETREIPIPRKIPVKPIQSCPLLSSSLDLPQPPDPLSYQPPSPIPPLQPDADMTYAQVSKGAGPPGAAGNDREKRKVKAREGGSVSPCPPGLMLLQEPAYSLPFNHIGPHITADPEEMFGQVAQADPLYDIIDDSQIKHALRARAASSRGARGRAEHIYDQPEGYGAVAAPGFPSAPTYDELEEVRGNAWRTMGIDVEPPVHEPPYSTETDSYAIPKLWRRAPVPQVAVRDVEADDVNPYKNVIDGAEWEGS
ncbi:unnamed protein product [Arctogadus glacialis]